MTDINMDDFAKSLIGKAPYAIYQAIRDLDREKGEGTAISLLQPSKEFGKYCSQQMKAFLENRLALTKRDADNIDKWWKFSLNNFSLEDIQKAQNKISQKEYIRSERYFDFDYSKTVKLFKDNILDIQDEMDMPPIEGTEHIRLEQRQKIVDFIRFMTREGKTIKLINDNDWEPIRNEFNGFPKMSMKYLLSRYNKSKQYNIEHPQKQKTEEERFFARIIDYRINNILDGKRKINLEEIQLAEAYVKSYDAAESKTVQSILAKLAEMKKEIESSQAAQDENVDAKKKETTSQEKEEKINEVASQSKETQHVENASHPKEEPKESSPKRNQTIINFIEEDDEEEKSQTLTDEKDTAKESEISAEKNNISKEEPNVSAQNDIPSADEIINQVENKENSDNNVDGIVPQDNSILNIDEIEPNNANENVAYREDDSAVESPEEKPQKIEEEVQIPLNQSNSWQGKTLSDWKDWGKKNNKFVQEYKPTEKATLSFKVYDNAEKAKADEFDADITYRKENDVVVKGHKGKIPSDEVFAAIVAQAKKNGTDICFGDIKSSIFKAKLMLACLNDPEVKMVNRPKLSELTDLPEDLKAKLKEKLPRPTDHVKGRMDKLNKEKTGYSRSGDAVKGSSDKSSERPNRDGKFRSDNKSKEGKSFRPHDKKSSKFNPALQKKIIENSNGI